MADEVPAARITAPMRSLSVRGQWAPGLAGGCPKNETFGSNPQFVLKPSKPAAFEIEVSQPASGQMPLLPIGIALVRNKPGKPFKAPLSKKKLVAKTMSWRSESSNYCSITLEPLLLEAANMIEGEKVHILNCNNGERFETYIITGERNSGVVCLNGPAARRVAVGDIVIVCSYASMEFEAAKTFKPWIVFPDTASNKVLVP